MTEVIETKGKESIDMSEFEAKDILESDDEGMEMEVMEGDMDFDDIVGMDDRMMGEPLEEYVPVDMGDPARRRSLIMNLNGYKTLLAHKLTDYMFLFDGLEHKTQFQLEDTLKEVQVVVSQSGSADSVFAGYLATIGFFENFAPMFGMNLENMAAILQSDPRTRDLVIECYLENQNTLYLPPSKRLIIHTLQAAMAINGVNKARTNKELKQKVDVSQFDDSFETPIDKSVGEKLKEKAEGVVVINTRRKEKQ